MAELTSLDKANRDGATERGKTYRSIARRLVRRLVPLLERRPGGGHLGQAAQVLRTVGTPSRHPARVAQVGRLLQSDPGDVHAVYLGARLVAIGDLLRLRQAPSRADLSQLMGAWELVSDLLFGEIPNDPGHLVPVSQRLDQLRTAAAAMALERQMLPKQGLQAGAEHVGVAHAALSREIPRGCAPSLLLRIDQVLNERRAQEMRLSPGQEYVSLCADPEAGTEGKAIAYSTADVLLSELAAATWLVRCEAPCWHPADQERALSLLRTIHGALQDPPDTRQGAAATGGHRACDLERVRGRAPQQGRGGGAVATDDQSLLAPGFRPSQAGRTLPHGDE